MPCAGSTLGAEEQHSKQPSSILDGNKGSTRTATKHRGEQPALFALHIARVPRAAP